MFELSAAWKSCIGCSLAFISAVLYAAQGLFFEMIQTVFFMESMLVRIVLTTGVCAVVMVCREEVLFKNWDDLKWLTITSMCFLISAPTRYYAIVLIPYADVFALALSGVMVFSLVFGRLLLKETCGVFEIFMCTFILIGMSLISDPKKIYYDIMDGEPDPEWTFFLSKRVLGFTLAMVDCVATGLISLCCRKIKHIHVSVLMFHAGLYTIPLSILMTQFIGRFSLPQSGYEYFAVAMFAIVGSLFNLTVVAAYHYEEAGTVSTIRTVEIAISYLLQYLFLNVQPTLPTALGAVFVTAASFAFGFRTCKKRQETEDEEKYWGKKVSEDKKLIKSYEPE